jgi:hypothetical protein
VDLKGTKYAVGWKSRLKVVKGLSNQTLATFNKESLREDDPLIDDFMAARDYESFKRFCKSYGLIMLRPWIEGVTVNRAGVPGATWSFNGRETIVSEAELRELWTAIQGKIKVLQYDVKKLQQEQESEPAEFVKHLNKGLKPVRVKAIKTSGGDGYDLVPHGEDLKAAMYLQIILAGVPLTQCEGCPGVFLRTRPDRKYCSASCQASAHKREPGEVIRRKNQTRARFYRLRDKDPERAAEIKSDVLADLKEVRTMKAVSAIEKRYHLEPRKCGPKKGGGKG